MDGKRTATEDFEYFFIDPEKISNKIVPFSTLTFWLSKEKKIKVQNVVSIKWKVLKSEILVEFKMIILDTGELRA